MCTCAVCPKTHCFVFLWFSTTYCWCHEQLLSNNVSLYIYIYALGRSQWPWPDWAYARTDPVHRCLMILAIDFSQYLAPTPPPTQKKSPWEHLITSTFEVPSTHCCKKFDPGIQIVCIGYQRWHKQVLWMLTCALPGFKFENPCLCNIYGCFSCFTISEWAISYKGGKWKIILKDGKCRLRFPP